jgi:hypothetical protein
MARRRKPFSIGCNSLQRDDALCASVQGITTLTAIHPDGKRLAPSRHIPVGNEAALENVLERLHTANSNGWGAYVSIATRKRDLGRWRRGGRDDLLALPALFVDIDQEPEQALHRLHDFTLPPSCVVRSGFGIHAHWILREPTTEFDLANRILCSLAAHFDGDRTNVVGMLRIPGTINTKPIRAGALCHLIDLYPDRRYQLADFAEFAAALPMQRLKSRPQDFSRLTFSHTINPTLVRGVVECLLSEFQGYVKPNGYIASLCPCGHCHDHPGAHFNFDPSRACSMCFGRHGRLLLKDLCELLRLDPVSFGGLYT